MNQIRHVLILLLFFNACKEKEMPVGPSPIDPSETIFPLKVGNKWMIQVTNYDTTGAVVYTKLDSIRILRDTTIQNEQWFIGYGILANRSDGLYDYQPGSASQASLRSMYPAPAGTSYSYRGVTVKVLSVADTVTVQAGTFVCYHYRTGIDSVSYTDEYLARGVGLIRSESFNPRSSDGVYRYLTYELLAFVSQ